MSNEKPENNIVRFPEPPKQTNGRIGSTTEMCEWINQQAEAIIICFDDEGRISIASQDRTDMELMDSMIYALRYLHDCMEKEVQANE